ncbi:hypothetical protein [Luteimonas abyssi]|uniref:hypothetical protein n=1 Tax=Luteimonas abyssi TaxID=1247514 RepID=UPI000737D2AB|nr:hypothetical protein [Luteimonas abyssi]
MRRARKTGADAAPSARPPMRRRRLGLGMGILAAIVVVLMGLQWYRGHQLVDSCTGNGGRWDAERQACTFGGPDSAPSTSTPAPPEPAPQ